MNYHFSSTFRRSLLIAAVFALLLAPGAWAETYSSSGSHYPKSFDNNIFDTDHNDCQYMDAVYFAGKEIIFFTFTSDVNDSYNSQLLYYTPGFDYSGSLNIGNSIGIDLALKTCVMGDVLYLFYTPNGTSGSSLHTGTIYYRTITIDYGSTGKDWKMVFSDVKSLATGLSSVSLRVAGVMNGTMYLIYTGDSSFYYISSQDGLKFSQGTHFFSATDPTINGASGAVFQIPNASTGCNETFMLAYAAQNGSTKSLKYFFFDGKTYTGPFTIATPSLYPSSVRLIAGSASGYTNTKYSIQVWLATIHSGSEQHYDMYHAEYIPDGPYGDEGTWSSSWARLNQSSSDTIENTSDIDTPDFDWAVIPYFKKENGNVRMYLHIWYPRGTSYTWPSTDKVNFRCSSYQSDLLQYVTTSTVLSAQQDMSTSTVLGIIEGTPPFPLNGGIQTSDTQISTVELQATSGIMTSTSATVGGTVVASYGGKFLKMGVNAKLTAGLRYTKAVEQSLNLVSGYSLASFGDALPGDLGWALVLKPEIINSQYELRSYDGSQIAYGSDTSDNEFLMSVIQYGSGSTVATVAYELQNPPYFQALFQGMATRPLSTDLDSWQTVTQNYLQGDGTSYGMQQLFTLTGTLGSTGWKQIESATTNANTYTTNAGFTASAKLLGFSTSASVNYAMKITSQTSLQSSLGFYYNLPACGESGDCVSTMCVVPSILVPSSDAGGYNAPWISDDIRNHQKPKPWCLSYLYYPTNTTTTTRRLSVVKAGGSMYIDRTRQNADRMTASLTLERLPSGFSFDGEQLIHLRFGNYVINSEVNPVYYRDVQGQYVLLQLREAAHPYSNIRVKLKHNRSKSLLVVQLDADWIDLADLSACYKFRNADTSSEGLAKAIPFELAIGGEYYAKKTLDVTYTARKNKWARVKILGPR